MSNTSYLFTSEAVSAGHPDKVADQISDAVLDAYLAKDAEARVAAEVLVCTDRVVLAGESRSNVTPDYEAIARKTVADIGYKNNMQEGFDAASFVFEEHMVPQSAEIAQGVDAGDRTSEGAGDQGIMFGYAINETPTLMPAPLFYAQELLRALAKRREGGDDRLSPDAKSQITLTYKNSKPVHAHTILVSHQHREGVTQDDLRGIVNATIDKVMPAEWLTADTRVLVNPTGSFVKGGPAGDTGLTGRKIIVDTYGGMARHGGGAFSGKDPTKVDRSAAYAARYLAKNIVAAGLAHACEIQLCYAIGVPEPLAIYVDAHGTLSADITEDALVKAIYKSMDLTPKGIRTHLGLNKAIYLPTAAYGHFGRMPTEEGHFGWEKTDLAAIIKQNI